jgi:hypothetical protein
MKSHLLVAAAVALAIGMPAIAQNQEAQSPAVLEQIQLASTLARYGEARRDPILMLAAAKIAKGVEPVSPPMADELPSMDDMLGGARTFSNGDALVTQAIGQIEGQQSKAYCYGPYGLGWC